ncbi:MAG: STAS domain-containing protein [Planctomycetota bacterium]|jgi:anti-anti-sigma regulatory factor
MEGSGVKADTRSVRIIKIGVDLGDGEIDRLNKEITRAVIEKQSGIVYDCVELVEITSGQAAIFFGLLATVRDQGLAQAIANPNDAVIKIFDLVGISQAVKVCDSIIKAVDAVHG